MPAFAASDRGVIDLLAVERGGRLAVLELKASEDIHLPLQALDYWIRVKWHLDAREFSSTRLFSRIRVDATSLHACSWSRPRSIFIPPMNACCDYFSPGIPVERVGVGLQWRRELKVVSRS